MGVLHGCIRGTPSVPVLMGRWSLSCPITFTNRVPLQVSTLVLKPSQMAIICLSFAQYAVEAFVSECEPPSIIVKIVALLAIVCILFVNCYSVNLGMAVQNVFTAAKLVAVCIVIVGGGYKLFQGNTQHLQNAFTGPTPSLGVIATAFYTGLWAYDGWNNLNYVTEEIQNPSK